MMPEQQVARPCPWHPLGSQEPAASLVLLGRRLPAGMTTVPWAGVCDARRPEAGGPGGLLFLGLTHAVRPGVHGLADMHRELRLPAGDVTRGQARCCQLRMASSLPSVTVLRAGATSCKFIISGLPEVTADSGACW